MASIAQDERPTWRKIVDYPLVAMVIAILICIVGIVVAGVIAKFAVPPIRGFTFETNVALVGSPILVLLYVFVISRLGYPKRNDYDDPHWLRRLLLGVVGGTLVFSAAVAVAAALGIYKIVGVGSLNGLLPALIGSAIFPAINEEMLFRGILFRWLEQFGGSWVALALTSVLFGAAHLANPNASWIAAGGIAIEAGVMLGAAYMLTRSLWLPMGLHAAWNFTQGEIYDIPVSGTKVDGMVDAQLAGNPLLTGNGFGLEASVIAIAVATIFGFWLLWKAIEKGELKRPSWAKSAS
jgi:membrane protease YdiL (CAAX protease family)